MTEILDSIGLPALLEQLAEECGELTQAALKLARLRRGENPTPKTEKECRDALVEEMADVQLVIDLLTMSGVIGDAEVRIRMGKKMLRWLDRIEEARRQQAEEGEQK